jgi:hypothetical protein
MRDAITDNGQETWNLLAERGIENVILCGVHLNMCVLGRPFAIRQMVKLGKNVALMRDMTDTMYNPERPPGVSHFEGTDLMIQHVEKFWCPSFTSNDITGKPCLSLQRRSSSRRRELTNDLLSRSLQAVVLLSPDRGRTWKDHSSNCDLILLSCFPFLLPSL